MNSFFSRDTFLPSLKRSARIRTRKPSKRTHACPSTSLKGRPLGVIQEISEDDELLSALSPESEEEFYDDFSPLYPSSRHPTGAQTLGGPRARTSSDVSIVDFEIERRGEARLSAYEFSIDDTLLMPPRSAPSPPTSPSSPFSYSTSSFPTSPAYVAALSGSPDSFRLTFSDNVSLSFPHPPRPSSADSSPSSHNSDLPTTPTSSDDEFTFIVTRSPSPSERRVRSKRASIKPLFINKSTPDLAPCDVHDNEIPQYSTSPFALPNEKQKEQKWEESDSESDAESDYDAVNDWYNQQFSDILSLCSSPSPNSTTPPPTILPPARPDSILSLSPLPIFSPTVATGAGRSRNSKPLPEIPAVFFPSPQLDPTFPRRKRTICAAPPIRPLPPAPASPAAARPPPRMSVPLDMGFDDEVDILSQSSASIYSQADEVVDDEEEPVVDEVFELNMELDMPLGLPLSLPSTPIDLELEFARLSGSSPIKTTSNNTRLSVIPESSEPATPVARSYRRDSELQTQQVQEMDRILRSRWSTSTLSSMDREPPPSASSRLQFLFGGSRKGKAHGKSYSLSSPMSPAFPSTPSPSKREFGNRVPSSPFTPSPSKKEFNRDSYNPGFGRTVRRSASRSSTSTNSSTSSGDSSGSSGLRRKPIPVELFVRC